MERLLRGQGESVEKHRGVEGCGSHGGHTAILAHGINTPRMEVAQTSVLSSFWKQCP